MTRQSYPGDLTDAEWKILEPFIPAVESGGRPAKYERREIVNAILYVLRTGCGWEYLPHDFPKWKTVYHYFRHWQREGVWEEANASLTRTSRRQQGRDETPSLGIIDTQSVQTTEKGG